MKRGNKILIIFMSAVLLMSVIVGIATRKSYSNNLDLGRRMQQADSLSFLDHDDFVKTYFDNNINGLSQLKEKSDVIVKVRATDDRQMISQTILSKVEILDVYKGANLKEGDAIYIYEPNYFINNSYTAMYGYNLLVNNNEYVFFLKKLKVPDGYKYKGKEKISYMPVSTIYSKYATNGEAKTEVVNTEELNLKFSFEMVEDMDIIIDDENILGKYNKMKEAVLNMAK